MVISQIGNWNRKNLGSTCSCIEREGIWMFGLGTEDSWIIGTAFVVLVGLFMVFVGLMANDRFHVD